MQTSQKRMTKVYSESSRIFTMELLQKKALSQIFEWALNTPPKTTFSEQMKIYYRKKILFS